MVKMLFEVCHFLNIPWINGNNTNQHTPNAHKILAQYLHSTYDERKWWVSGIHKMFNGCVLWVYNIISCSKWYSWFFVFPFVFALVKQKQKNFHMTSIFIDSKINKYTWITQIIIDCLEREKWSLRWTKNPPNKRSKTRISFHYEIILNLWIKSPHFCKPFFWELWEPPSKIHIQFSELYLVRYTQSVHTVTVSSSLSRLREERDTYWFFISCAFCNNNRNHCFSPFFVLVLSLAT